MRRLPIAGIAATALAFIAAAGAPAAPAEQSPERTFESLFGDGMRRVQATREPEDDVALARQLVEFARKNEDADLQAIVCRKAYLLGWRDASGFDVAIEAMVLLEAVRPESTVECRENISAVRERAFDEARGPAWNEAGEALIDALLSLGDARLETEDYGEATVTYRKALAVADKVRSPQESHIEARIESVDVHRRLAALRRKVEKDPSDRAAREELLKLYLIEMDDPERASKYVEADRDDNLDKYILVAAMNPDSLPDKACLELGKWYREHAEEASAAARPAMLERARTYYARYLEVHEEEDAPRAIAAVALKEIEAEIAELESPERREARWVNLLAMVDLRRHALSGKWTIRGGKLGTKAYPQCYCRIPAWPEGSYEMEVSFIRTLGVAKGVLIALPVGKTMGLLRLSARPYGDVYYGYTDEGYSASGLELVNGAAFAHNGTTVQPARLPNGRLHEVHVKVLLKDEEADINVQVDGKPYIRWKGPPSAITPPAMWGSDKPPAGLGVGADHANIVFHTMRLRMISGQLRRGR
jgi:hypothetical protein